MSKFIHKSHNVSILMYHIVCPSKYRKIIFDQSVEDVLKVVCLEISIRYEIEFLEIGADDDHVHFLVQSVSMYSPKKVVQVIKSITAKEIFLRHPEIKRALWGGEFWSKGYYISSVGRYGNEGKVLNYVKKQGQNYKVLHRQASKQKQLKLWDD
jgi:putative transposase